jgi:pyrroloquinoline quinone (PQQ) biosynthesis protein C
MRCAAGRLRANGNAALAQHCSDVADQESGHDELALKDLEALGIRSVEFVSDVRPRNSVELVALFERLAQGANPVSVLGYAYALERFALFKTQETIDAIEAIVPSGTMATRCLRVHSAIGSDARHMASSIDVVARLSPADRTAVMHAAFETAARITTPTDYPGDEAAGELQARYRR